MEKRQFETLRIRLERQRQEARQFLSRFKQETGSLEQDVPQDSADRSVIHLSQESLFEQASQRQQILRRVERAMQRMDEGSFGVCAECGKDIPLRRLEVLPWTQYCVHCQEMIERGEERGSSRVERNGEGLRRTG
jgi:DnaK suppressor protein